MNGVKYFDEVGIYSFGQIIRYIVCIPERFEMYDCMIKRGGHCFV